MVFNPNVANMLTGRKSPQQLIQQTYFPPKKEAVKPAPKPAPKPSWINNFPKVVSSIYNPIGAISQSKTAQEILKSVGQESTRNIVSIGQSVTDPNETGREFFPKSRFAKAILGTDKPIPQIGRRIDEAANKAREMGDKYKLFNDKASEESKRKSSLLIGGGAVALASISDLIPAGKSSKLLKSLTKLKEVEEIAPILKKLGVIESAIPKLSKEISTLEDVSEIKKLVNSQKPKSKLSQTIESAETELIDRFAPIKNFVKNRGIKTDNDPYVAARNFAGHFGKVQNRLGDLSNILRPAKNVIPTATIYAKLERFEELAKRGITKFEGGKTIENITAEKLALEKELGDALPEVKTFINELRAYSDNLLTEAKDGGIISEDVYSAIRKNNEKYIPLQRLEYLSEQADNIPRGSNSFSVSSQSLIKGIQGSEKEIADPIESIIRNTYKTVNLVERNKVALKIADLSQMEEFKDLIIPIKGEIPTGMEKLSVFRNGIKEEYAIPKEITDAVKGLNEKSIDIITRVASVGSSLLRAGATSLNLGFLPSNVIRDFQTATITSNVGFTPLDWGKGFWEAVKKGDDYKAFLESGASFSGYFESGKNLAKTVKKLSESKTKSTIKTIVNPLELMRIVGETLELAPRLGVFKRSARKGLSETEAAFNARNATVDFAKAGSSVKVVNLWIPFLNARLQGTANTLRAFKERPVKSLAKATALIGIPAVATYIHNTRLHKEVWDDIAQYEKDNNFILIFGDEKDGEGNPTQVVKIPKGDVGRFFANPIEEFLEYMNSNDPKSIGQVATEMFSSTLPIDLTRDGKFSLTAAGSSLTPQILKPVIETGFNKNLYTGRDVVPQNLKDAAPEEQYKESTSPIAKALGKFFNISPMHIENVVGTTMGGLGKQLINPTKAPGTIIGRFTKVSGGETTNKDFDKLKEIDIKNTTEKVAAKHKAEQLFKEIKDLSPSRRAEVVNDKLQRKEIDEKVIAELGVVVENNAKNLSSFEKSFKSQSNDTKAVFIVEKLSSMPIEERGSYFLDLFNKGLISDELQKKILEEIKRKVTSETP